MEVSWLKVFDPSTLSITSEVSYENEHDAGGPQAYGRKSDGIFILNHFLSDGILEIGTILSINYD